MFYLLTLFIVVPFVELILLLWLADHTSWQLTVLIVLVTGVIGSIAARRQGIGIWLQVQRQMHQGSLPGAAIFDGVLVLIAGALLITPGLLTDFVGFSLLVPWVRRLVRRKLMNWLIRRTELRVNIVREEVGEGDDDRFVPHDFDEDGTFDSHAVPSEDEDGWNDGESRS